MERSAGDARLLTLEEARHLARTTVQEWVERVCRRPARAEVARHATGLYECSVSLLEDVGHPAACGDLASFVIAKGFHVQELTRAWRALLAEARCELAFSDSELVLCGNCGHMVWPQGI